MTTLIITVVLLIIFALGVFSKNDTQQLTDFELYGMDADVYSKYMSSSELFKMGFDSAVRNLKIEERGVLLNQAKNCIDNYKTDFDKGWNYTLNNY